MKNKYSIKKVNLLALVSAVSFLFLFSCSEDSYEEDISSLETTTISQSTSSSSVKLSIPTMTASAENSNYPVENANDDDYNTRWRADGSGINLIADLGSTRTVDYIKVSHSSGTSRVYSFELWTRETSSTDWIKNDNYSSPGDSNSVVVYDLSDQQARFVRLKCNGNNVNNRNEVKKFEVWGGNTIVPQDGVPEDDNNDNNDNNDDDDDDNSSTSNISTNDGSFDLNGYDIESSSHLSSSSDTKTTTEDNDDFSTFDEYYELRGGDYYLKSAEREGKRTEWKESTQRALTSSRTMKYEAEVNNIPENGVTIAQVHNRGGVNRPYIRVYIEDGYIHIKETTNDLEDSKGEYNTYPEDDEDSNNRDDIPYRAGDKFKVQMVMGNGRVNVKIETASDSYEVDLTPSTLPSSYRSHFYFKAGVYTEGDNTEPEIRFYSFED